MKGRLLIILMFLYIFGFAISLTQLEGKYAVEPTLLLREMFEETLNIKDYKCIFIKSEIINNKWQTEEIDYLFKSPNNIRMNWIQPRKGLKVYYDGTKLHVNPIRFVKFFLDPKSSLGHLGSNHFIDESDLLSIVNRIRVTIQNASGEIRLLGKSIINSEHVYIIELLAAGQESNIYCHRALVWINIKSKLPYQLEFFNFKNTLFERFTFVNLETNIEMPDSDFQL